MAAKDIVGKKCFTHLSRVLRYPAIVLVTATWPCWAAATLFTVPSSAALVVSGTQGHGLLAGRIQKVLGDTALVLGAI